MFIILRRFLQLETSAGIILMFVTIVALLIANSEIYPLYQNILHTPLDLKYGNFIISKSILFWINDGLMVIFFFLIGLEIKREFLEDNLSIPYQRILPITAAFSGIIFPALIFTLFNYHNNFHMRGWAIPTATDIAFALGVLSLIKGIPKSLRVFLLTIAVLDDLAAVLIIAFFYTKKISIIPLVSSFFILVILCFLNKLQLKKISVYIILSISLWIFVLQSGVHSTVAGVLAAFTIPIQNSQSGKSPLSLIETTLHPWVAYAIIPIFAFANAGLHLKTLNISNFTDPLTLGIMLGLFLGKQLGVLIGTWIPVKLKWGKLPANVSWVQIYGVSILCGIGFTMSLFIGTLAFGEDRPEYDLRVRLGILTASFLCCMYGYFILKFAKIYK